KLNELEKEMGIRKKMMSQLIREIIDMNIEQRVFKKGVRKDLYRVEEDYYETFISLFTSTWQRAISRSRHFEQRLMKKIDELKENESLTPENEAAMNE